MQEVGISAEGVCEGKYDRRLDCVLMLIFKELSSAETSYWPTELETLVLVFAVKKIRHLAEANDFPTIIRTDHVAVKHTDHSTSLKTTSPECSNMRLIEASQYLSQFRLDMRYRPGKDNIPAVTLSRIKQIETADIFTTCSDIVPSQDRPDGTHSTCQVSVEFVQWSAEALKNNQHYRSIYSDLCNKPADRDQVESYGWIMKVVQLEGHPLLFVQKGTDGLRVCIPNELAKHVLKAAH